MIRPRPAFLWVVYLVVAAALAAYAVAAWIGALLGRAAILYGEGAVANAARLARDRVAYLDVDPQHFVAANYPPLYFHMASLGDPFVAGRVASIVSTISVAALIFVAARAGGRVFASSLSLGWLALAPVAIWGPAVKPDLVALALTAAAVLILDRRRDLAAVAGFALVFAALAKPTAILPAVALAVWLASTQREVLVRFVFGLAVGAVGAAITIYLDSFPDVWRHVVTWNALTWSASQAVLLIAVALLVVGIPAGVAILAGGFKGARAAYGIAALAIIVLGGREGATINYLLDACVAVAFALAAIGPRLRADAVLPVLAVVQLVAGTLALDPLSVVPGRAPTTGAWADPNRGSGVFFNATARQLAEDSGVLVRIGIEPVVDDLFLWSRLVERGTIDAEPVLAQLRDGRIATVISEVDLEHLDGAPGYERQRWAKVLVATVLDRYRLEAHAGTLWLYVPR